MIYTILNGRCGNQLFSYSFSKRLSKEYCDEVVFLDRNLINQDDKTFCVELDGFCINKLEFDHTEKHPVYAYGNLLQKIVFLIYSIICRVPVKDRPSFYKRQTSMQPILNKFGLYFLVHGYSDIRKTKMKNKFVEGTWEDRRWFDDVRPLLLEELRPKVINEKNSELMKVIKERESVCVTVRRGDFLNDEFSKMRSICDEEYFRKAISIMKKERPDAVFIFFSDEIEWVRENYDFGVESYYETGSDSVQEKLRLMSSCKNFILSNSTFSWWAEYLSTSDEKITISPDRWFNMPGYKHQLINDDWILIGNEKNRQ